MMKKDLIINFSSEGADIAMLEGNRLAELTRTRAKDDYNLGDVYLGKVLKLMPGMNAAFVDIGYKKNAFIHYTDMSPHVRSLQKVARMAAAGQADIDISKVKLEAETSKAGQIGQVISKKDPLPVQIFKEPIATKGHRLTTDISLPGRYLVLSPFHDHVSVSRKIESREERKRLQVLIESIKPRNYGVIVRTAAEGQNVAALHLDLAELVDKWKSIVHNMTSAIPPKKLLSEINKTSALLRDVLSDSFSSIVVNSKEQYNDIRAYINQIAPDKKDIVQLYNGRQPIFDNFDITRQIKAAFGKTIYMDSGAYLLIEKTEAMHVIDVNSGNTTVQPSHHEEQVLKINLEAAVEIARQMRLRDLGGIITIDFIDMRNPNFKKELVQAVTDAMASDRASHTILPLNKFNTMQITRERVKPELQIETEEVCPVCNGTGKIGPSLLTIDTILKNIDLLISKHSQGKIKLHVHPFVAAYLKQGLNSMQVKWLFKYRRWIPVIPNDAYHLTEYRFFDGNGEEIEI